MAPSHSSRLAAFLAILVVGGSGLGALIYQGLQSRRRPPLDATGFDISGAPEGAVPQPHPVPERTEPSSGLGMVKTGLPGLQFGAKSAPAAPSDPAASLTALVRQNEDKTRALYAQYKSRYPVLRQYERDWASYPDLKKLHEDYRQDHDPVKFLRGLVRSRNFGVMVKKYATEPAVRDFVKEEIKAAPSGIISAGVDFLQSDKNMKSLVDNVVSALGIPPGLLGGGSEAKVDQKAVMDSVMKSHPELQNAAESGGK